jgi:hypothetical protein
MKKQTKYLDFYKKCMKTGVLPERGLCSCCEIEDDMIKLFKPYEGFSLAYWGYNGDEYWWATSVYEKYAFTKFRQTIVLLMAAMNNEL